MRKLIVILLIFIILTLLGLMFFVFVDSGKMGFWKSFNFFNENVEEQEILLVEKNNVEKNIPIKEKEISNLENLPENSVKKEKSLISKSNLEKELAEKTVLENLAPDFTLLDLKNNEIKLSNYRGKKPVIVEFWNSWCHHCQRNMPKLQKIYNKNKDKIEIIGVNLLKNQDSKEKVASFVKQNKITFPVVFDEDFQVVMNYDISFTNTQFLINTDGTIFEIISVEDLSEEKLKEFLEKNGI